VNRILIKLTVGFLFSSPLIAFADDQILLGKDVVTSPNGQPFCDTSENLQEYVLAAFKGDSEWIATLKAHCTTLKGGIKIRVIEDIPSDSPIGHVVKIRLIVKNISALGYTLSVGLVEEKSAK